MCSAAVVAAADSDGRIARRPGNALDEQLVSTEGHCNVRTKLIWLGARTTAALSDIAGHLNIIFVYVKYCSILTTIMNTICNIFVYFQFRSQYTSLNARSISFDPAYKSTPNSHDHFSFSPIHKNHTETNTQRLAAGVKNMYVHRNHRTQTQNNAPRMRNHGLYTHVRTRTIMKKEPLHIQ